MDYSSLPAYRGLPDPPPSQRERAAEGLCSEQVVTFSLLAGLLLLALLWLLGLWLLGGAFVGPPFA
jgi:hypothetical protein